MSIRKALMVGINAYLNAPLRGCVNDVLQIRDLLKDYYGFQDQDFRLLLDDAATREGIIAGLQWLAEGGNDTDAVRVFHYSGHGSYVADQNGDEPEGRDECLVPYDYVTAKMIIDDALKELYDRFPKSGNLTLVMDCCHSGSNNKAPGGKTYRFIPLSEEEQRRIDAAAAKFAEEQNAYIVGELRQVRGDQMSEKDLAVMVRKLMGKFQKSRFGDIRTREANILLAGCRPDQQAADARIAGGYHGAFTYYLADVIKHANGQITYGDLADKVGESLYAHNFVQVPQVEYRGRRNQHLAFMPFP